VAEKFFSSIPPPFGALRIFFFLGTKADFLMLFSFREEASRKCPQRDKRKEAFSSDVGLFFLPFLPKSLELIEAYVA